MYLQKIEIQGFKSFARKTVLEFNRQFTAIVGPNGSGKSNVADAIRWVLGEQSIKTLRGKKAEDVIFAGSDKRGRLGMAEVSIYLNNADGSAPIEFNEVVITRRVFRDGQSEYLLNGNQVRLQDIQLLLARANVGQRTYSVIGQGMVDSILSSSASERKEFFEEATGVKQYQLKREQAISKLIATYENLEQATLVLQEIEPRLKVLTRQVKRLEHREELMAALRQQQKVYYRYRYWFLETQRQAVIKQVTSTEQAWRQQQEEVANLRLKLKNLEAGSTISADWQKLQSRQNDLRHDLGRLTKELAMAQAEEEIGHFKKGEGEIAWLKQRLEEVEGELAKITAQRQSLFKESEAKQQLLSVKLQEQSRTAELINNLSRPVSDTWLSKELKQLQTELQLVAGSLSKAEDWSQVKELAKQAESLSAKLNNLLGKLIKPESVNDSELSKLWLQREKISNEVGALQSEINSLVKLAGELKVSEQRLQDSKLKVAAALSNKTNGGRVGQKAEEIKKTMARVEEELAKVDATVAEFHSKQEAGQAELFQLQRNLEQSNNQQSAAERQWHEFKLELTKLETRLEDLERELAQEVDVELTQEIKEAGSVDDIDEPAVALELQKLKRQLELTGGIEPEVVTEYQQTKTRFDFLTNQTADLNKAAQSLEEIIQDLDKTIEKKFVTDFKLINEKFTEYFKILFLGGKAQLTLQRNDLAIETSVVKEEVNSDAAAVSQPLTPRQKFLQSEKIKAAIFAGVEIQATPPGKKLSSITALSGGEKALTSIALICAIISCNPSPFVVLDEVDAALDESNSDRFAAILENLNRHTQFIAISHNRATMKRADILYGVTMEDDGVSKLLSVKLEEAKELAE